MLRKEYPGVQDFEWYFKKPLNVKHRRCAVVSYAKDDLGFEVVKGLCRDFKKDNGIVHFVSDDEANGKAALAEIQKEGCEVKYQYVRTRPIDYDVIHDMKLNLYSTYGGLDLLVNLADINHNEVGGTNHSIALDTVNLNFNFTLQFTMMMMHLFRPNAKIIHLANPYANLSTITNEVLRDRFMRRLSTRRVYVQMHRFLRAVEAGNHTEEGWPQTSYLASKLAIAKLASVEQQEMDRDKFTELVNVTANCIYPGEVRLPKNNYTGTVSAKEGAAVILKLALIRANESNFYPRGKFVWYDMRIYNWTHDQLE